MTLDTLLLFLPACFALNLTFGPNNLLSVTVGAQHGLSTALMAALGRLGAFVLMIGVTALGLGALLMASELAFTVVKLLGAAYLVWLGIRLLRSDVSVPLAEEDTGSVPLRQLMRREFLVAIGNPKAILIFTAFFPQFIAPASYWTSFLVVGSLFLLLELVAIALYAYAGRRLSGVLRNARGLRWVNRVSGATMMAFGVLLAAARRPAA